MTKTARSFLVAASLLLAATPLLPVWRITLIAPQYPEGMGMEIRFNTIAGAKEHDLENINHLNHYIGMRVIEPADMPELRFMPWIVVGIAAVGLAAAATRRRAALYGWAALLCASGVAGMADFWWRTYTYGHTLDLEHAAIQIPGLAYQPPLLGVKQIANFTASAWPAEGGVLVGVVVLLTATAVWLSVRAARQGAIRSPASIAGELVGAERTAA
jgi:copper chaperone NosL